MKFGQPDSGTTSEGVPGELVALPPPGSLIPGFRTGILAVFAAPLFDRVKIEDAVGTISVQGGCEAMPPAAGLRASREGEMEGLDHSECGAEPYPAFARATTGAFGGDHPEPLGYRPET